MNIKIKLISNAVKIISSDIKLFVYSLLVISSYFGYNHLTGTVEMQES